MSGLKSGFGLCHPADGLHFLFKFHIKTKFCRTLAVAQRPHQLRRDLSSRAYQLRMATVVHMSTPAVKTACSVRFDSRCVILTSGVFVGQSDSVQRGSTGQARSWLHCSEALVICILRKESQAQGFTLKII